MQLDLGILILASLANLTIGLFTLFKDPRNRTFRYFAALTATLVAWTTANYFSLLPIDHDYVFLSVKLVLLFVALQNIFFLLFVASYTARKPSLYTKHMMAYMALSILTVALGIFPGYFAGYKEAGSTITPTPGPAIGIFMIHTIVTIVGGAQHLFGAYRKSVGRARKQYKYLLIASLAQFLVTPLVNFILPNAFGITSLEFLSPIYTLIFAGIIGYAMVSQRLFDIRLLVARSVAYVLTIAFLALLYTAIIFGVSNVFIQGQVVNTQIRVIYTVTALVLAFSFSWIKNFFDRLSNSIFFRDAYDPQQFLNDLNEVLVEKVELDALLPGSVTTIKSAIKAQTVTFLIRKTAYNPTRIIGDQIVLDDEQHEKLNRYSLTVPDKVIAVNGLEDGQHAFRHFLESLNVDVVIRLAPTLDYPVEGLGYVLIGPKQNGEAYNEGDIEVFEIVANELVIAIQNALRFEEIDQFNITLQDKIETATKQLKRTNEKLQALDETKDEFISMASHQLRTPLTSVKGYLSMVIEGDAGELNEMQQKLLGQAFASSQRMVYLIADLLNLSRLRTGKFVIEAAPVNLVDVVSGELDQLQEALASKNLELVFDKPKEFPALMLDETKIRQVLMNFIDNAIYYTPNGGHIVVMLKNSKETVEFTVKDNGIGVPKDEQHHLFNKFYRAGNARKARPDGTGLGLFMAKKVVVASGGAILFDSKEGKGSTFGFTFSKKKLAVADKPVLEVETA